MKKTTRRATTTVRPRIPAGRGPRAPTGRSAPDTDPKFDASGTVVQMAAPPVPDLIESEEATASGAREEKALHTAALPGGAERPTGRDIIYSLYLREVGRVSMLTREEEILLGRRVRQGDEAARERMITSNLRLVVKIARTYEDYGMPLLDLISEGNIGLMKAVDRYDPERGVKFSCYAVFWVKQYIRRALHNQLQTIRTPVHIQEKLFQIQRAVGRLRELIGREPSEAEISHESGLAEKKVRKVRQAVFSMVSLEAPMGDDGNLTGEVIADHKVIDPAQTVEADSTSDLLRECLRKLSPREQVVLNHRFGIDSADEQTLDEVGQRLGITRERVRQIQNDALRKLRKKFAQHRIKGLAA